MKLKFTFSYTFDGKITIDSIEIETNKTHRETEQFLQCILWVLEKELKKWG